jgi:alkanesulfonate monooxygenase SsuD/methylene tetrahydromethanopterin reductase-like flavin-dependent oxidoreductase (luciferase family)
VARGGERIAESTRLHVGVQLGTSNCTWAALREAAIRVEELGFDSLWVPDHLLAWGGRAPRLEAWQVLGALAPLTKTIRIGPLVTPVTFRHPGVLAKMAATLDHISHGRVNLGLGAGGMPDEHHRYGLAFGQTPVPLQRLEEAVRIVRSLLDEPTTSFRGRHYTLNSAAAEPKPVQRRLPLLIAGKGRAAIRLAARHAEMWNAICLPGDLARPIAVLRSDTSAAGRAPTAVAATVSFRLIVRDGPADIRSRIAELDPEWRDDAYRIEGSSDEMVEVVGRYVEAGADGLIVQMPAPFDVITLERLAARRSLYARAALPWAQGRHSDATS